MGASIEVLDFVTFTNASYSGGILITDWFNSDTGDGNKDIKITIRFLSNEVRADNLKIIVHKRKCASISNCRITQLGNNQISNELLTSIVKTAAEFEEEDKKKNKKQ